ncbi:MAG: tetratricopeptide repeat protein [Ginsengibacter sp.]
MKIAAYLLVIILSGPAVFGQNSAMDSLDRLIAKATSDTARINLELKKIHIMSNINLDTTITMALKTLEESKKINYYKGETNARIILINNFIFKGNFKSALEQLKYLEHFIKPSKDSSDLIDFYGASGFFYSEQNKYDTSILFYEKAIKIAERSGNTDGLMTNYINIGIAYQQQANYPMALSYQQRTLKIAGELKDEIDEAYAYVNMGITYANLGDAVRAEKNYLNAARLGKKNGLKNVELYAYTNLASMHIDEKKWAKVYEFGMKAAILGDEMGDRGVQASSLSRAAIALANSGKIDSALVLSDRAIAVADSSSQVLNIYHAYSDRGSILYLLGKWKDAIPFYEKGLLSVDSGNIYTADYGFRYRELSGCYEKTGNYTKALEAFKKSALVNDSANSKANVQKTTELTMNYDFNKKQQLQQAEQRSKDAVQKTKQLALTAALILVLALGTVAFVGFKNKQKSNLLLRQQKEQIEETLTQLKSTQTQLVHSEKMASLGELTAGIAHEIENPLNFVNNFSELNTELVDELQEELKAGRIDEAVSISNDIKANEQKINHHGKRADAIVKGMLEHSRTSTGERAPTDINALANEYLRLSFYAQRTKDKTYNATLQTDLDPRIGDINIVPQDIGRVLLNLYNNAFYSTSEKTIQLNGNYQPIITVSSKKLDNKIEIRIKDNGIGIPQKVLDKIFQPFFTTKPTGQGTGLGLSLSYDIIKAHGGEFKVETKEGEYAEFIIQLPS